MRMINAKTTDLVISIYKLHKKASREIEKFSLLIFGANFSSHNIILIQCTRYGLKLKKKLQRNMVC